MVTEKTRLAAQMSKVIALVKRRGELDHQIVEVVGDVLRPLGMQVRTINLPNGSTPISEQSRIGVLSHPPSPAAPKATSKRKKMHWTQRPENREKLAASLRKGSRAKKNGKVKK